MMTAPRQTSTSADPPGGCGPAWERPGARPAGLPASYSPSLRVKARFSPASSFAMLSGFSQ